MIIFFFNDTATTEIYTLSLHDALPIYKGPVGDRAQEAIRGIRRVAVRVAIVRGARVDGVRDLVGKIERSEEHTSELQSQSNIVCRLLLEKKKKKHKTMLIN